VSAVVAGVVLVGLSGSALADSGDQDMRLLLGQGWTFMEHGNLAQAEAAFSDAFATATGPNTAEVYYATAAVWWERRNAMAAYMWLSDATRAAKKSYTWDGGPDHDWDRRIAARRRFIEANFTVVKLRSPARGKPIPPLADPPSSDPVLASFSDLLSQVVAEGVAAKAAVQWVLIPNGTYWIGDRLVALDSGELDAAKAATWDLIADRGKARKTYAQRVADIGAGGSPARAAADKQAAGVLAEASERAKQEEQRRQAAREREDAAVAERRELEERRVESERRAAARDAAAERSEAEQAEANVRRAEVERAEAEAERAEMEARVVADKAETERGEAARAEANARRDAVEVRRAEEDRAAAEARGIVKAEKAEQATDTADERRRQREEWVRSRTQDSKPDTAAGSDRFTERRFFVAGAVGPALVARLQPQGSEVGAEWAAMAEVGGLIRLPGSKLSVALGVSYANLPVSGCSAAQTRSSVVALHGGVRVPVPISDRIWFAFRGGMHVGGGGSWPSGAARSACGAAKLAEGEGIYGVRLEGATGSGRLSYSALAWSGYSITLGPDLDATVFFGLAEGRSYVGVGFFLRHDQLLTAVSSDSYHFEVDGASATDIETVQLVTFDPKASMARLQLGFRATLMF